LEWVRDSAECLPFETSSIDSYTIAFGIRNVTDRDKALREAHRVLRRGGRFLCLEFTPVDTPVIKEVYDAYSLNVIPRMGKLIADDEESYRYLVESIRKFPDAETFAEQVQSAGFRFVDYETLPGGVVVIHSGFKL
jgi:ubiquinone/menaquinone biosynthesis methyltransferase